METANRLDPTVVKRIQQSRRELLDLSARNRLISTPYESSQGRKIDVVDERSEEVFRLLVRDRKAMSFLPGAGEDEKADGPSGQLAQPDDESRANGMPDPRHTDSRLQTRLTSERLQARLLTMYYDAQTYEQEQGVSILYLAIGFLKWYESDSSDKARFAPLLLVPVDLERPSAASRFHLRYREDDITTNLSLQAKLKGEFGISLPDVPEMDELYPESYFNAVATSVAGQSRWSVLRDDMVLWFFSFSKYLMYRDLDPANWPAHSPLGSNPNLSSLLGEGFVAEQAFCGDQDKIDSLIPVADMVHIIDADSSQTVVIEEVRRGRNLVVQGPPGTGKSQTIANLIGMAVAMGKKVLFVAEKMAALEVVYDRLDRLGLRAVCLELHSHKANKKAVLDELARTLALGRPICQESADRLERLQETIERLNHHSEFMNTPIAQSAPTPFEIMGRLTSLYRRGVEATNLGLSGLESWTASEFHERCRDVEDLQAHLSEIGAPADHPWCGVKRAEPILHAELRDLHMRLDDAVDSLTAVAVVMKELAELLGLDHDDELSLKDSQRLAQFAIRLVNSPPADLTRIVDPVWEEQSHEIAELVEHGRVLAATCYVEQHRLLEEFKPHLARVSPVSEHPCRGVKRAALFDSEQSNRLLAMLPGAIDSLTAVLTSAGELERLLGVKQQPDASLNDVEHLMQLATCTLKAPRLDRRQITHEIWDSRRDELCDIVKQGGSLSTLRTELGEKVAEVAWQTDLSVARRHLAGYGDSLFRIFNRNYREAVAALKGVLKGTAPKRLNDRLSLLDAVISVQTDSRSMDADGPVSQSGRAAFGAEWRGSQSDWQNLAQVLAWDAECRTLRLSHDHRRALADLDPHSPCGEWLNALTASLRSSLDGLAVLFESVRLDCTEAFRAASMASIPLPSLVDRLRKWQERPSNTTEWVSYQAARARLNLAGIGAIASALHDGTLSADAASKDLHAGFDRELERALRAGRRDLPENGPSAGVRSPKVELDFANLGHRAFGSQWKGLLSNWPTLEAVVKWDNECRDANLTWNHRQHLAKLGSLDKLRPPLRSLV